MHAWAVNIEIYLVI